ncbi:MAG: carbohydrate-binding family 9-like protein [Planctomycetota bacterium]|nr:carbohydrate-binding family 9-like protein [Planctomycetota bacterium]
MRILVLLLLVLSVASCAGTNPSSPKPAAPAAAAPPVPDGRTMRVRWAGKAPADQAPPVYRVVRMKNNPAIDANWDKPAWKDVKPLTPEYYMGKEPAHQPRVQAKVAYDDEYLYVIWRVEDNYVRAVATTSPGRVWCDSAVEFFFTPCEEPRKNGYYNLETNCTGHMLFASNVPGVPNGVTKEELAQVVITGSLKGPIDPEIAKPTTWTLEYKLPYSVLAKHSKFTRPGPGVRWGANFYKCADETSHPHWLTWAPVTWPEPSFHRPEFFGTLVFE